MYYVNLIAYNFLDPFITLFMVFLEKPLFVSVIFNGDHKTVSKMRYNLATLSFLDIAGFRIVVSVDDACINVL